MFRHIAKIGFLSLLAGCGGNIKNNYLPQPAYITAEQSKQAARDMQNITSDSPAWLLLNDYFKLRNQLCTEKGLGMTCEKLGK